MPAFAKPLLNPLLNPFRKPTATLRAAAAPAAAWPVSVPGLAALVLVMVLWVAAWAALAQQNALLWQRLTPAAVDRFVADQVAAPLPALPSASVLVPVCAQPPAAWRTWRPGGLRAAVAACLGNPQAMAQGSAGEQATARYQAMVAQQVSAAQAWLAEFDAQAPTQQAALQRQLQALQAQPAGALQPMANWAAALLPATLATPRQAVGRSEAVNSAAATLRARVARTQAQLQTLANASPAERLRGMALLATGLRLATDYGHAPAQVYLATDRASLAEALEWQRRAHGFVARGFNLSQLQALPAALLASALLLLAVVVVTQRGRALPTALWAMAAWLLGVGALVLTDLALTGEAALRYLAERQFLRFGVGDVAWPLTTTLAWGPDQALLLWWPLLLVAAGLVVMSRLRTGLGWGLAPVRAWVQCSAHRRWGRLPMAVLLLMGVAVTLRLGMPAAVSELLILLAVVGLATYLARQAPMANAGGGLQFYNLGVVAVALVAALGGAVWRGDLGHALVALALAAAFAWLVGGPLLRWSVVVLAGLGAVGLGICLAEGALVGPLAHLTQLLPVHAQDRMQALFDVFHAATSDLARVRWLSESAGASGWGPGYVPWQGLAAARLQDGLPLQGPSDYVLALVSALWGSLGGVALIAGVLALLLGAAAAGLRTALRPGMPNAVRWLAAVGGLGCLVMAFKVVLSVGGVSGVLPLTGLPVALLGYGPVTHLAALLYLTLALGAYSMRPGEASRGVNLHPGRGLPGHARQRGLALALAGATSLVLMLALGERQLRQGAGPQGSQHVAKARLDMAQALAQAMAPLHGVPAPAAGSANPANPANAATAATAASQPSPASPMNPQAPCAQLTQAVAAWNQRLAMLARPVRLGGAPKAPATTALALDWRRLLQALPADHGQSCPRLARTLGQMLDTDFERITGSPPGPAVQPGALAATAAPGPRTDAQRLAPFDRPRALGARPLDYTTANAWWGTPGCLYPAAQAAPLGCPAFGETAAQTLGLTALHTHALTDVWLQRGLAPRLHSAMRQPAGLQQVNHRTVPAGAALGLTLDAKLQPLAQRVADCYTGRLAGAECGPVLPRDAAWRQRYFGGADGLRAGALGLVLLEVDTGRVVAMAGAISDCSLANLGRPADAQAQGPTPALRAGSACAQLPDQRSAWLAMQHPALWLVPPGSAIKPLALLAGMDAGLVQPGTDAYWKAILAESQQRLPVQRTALAAGQRYLDVLAQVGYGAPAPDLMWGGAPSPASDAANLAAFRAATHAATHSAARPVWLATAYTGTAGLRATTMGLDQAEAIRREKDAGLNADQRHGPTVMREFVAARRLADAALGGGDIRINAFGLAALWRNLALRATGQGQAPAPHLVEQAGHPTPQQALGWASAQAAQRVLGTTSGVAASAWQGTAQGACRVVFGACPAQGVPGLSGKTGSADFLTEEDGPHVKPGMQLPAKLFGGVFTAPDGKRYAVAATALRVRQGNTATLELSSSAPAEAAFTLMREMGVVAGP